jgi:hypothetical protein
MVKKNYNSRKRSRNRKSLSGGGKNMMCIPHKDILMEEEEGTWPNPDGPGHIIKCKEKKKIVDCEKDNPTKEIWNKCFWSNTYDTQFDELRELIKNNNPDNETYKIFKKPDEGGDDGEGDDDEDGEGGDDDGEGDDEMAFGGGGRLRRKSRRKRKGQRKSRRSKRGRSRRNPRRNRRSRRR